MRFAVGFVKCLLFMSIATFVFSGLTLIVVSAQVFHETKAYGRVGEFVESQYSAPLVTLMVVGSATILFSTVGIWATIEEKQNALILFIGVTFALFLCEVTVGSIAFLRSNDIGSNIQDKMYNSLSKYPSDAGVRAAYDAMQRNLECCGVSRSSDYVTIFHNSSVPSSCCTKETGYMCQQTWSLKVIHQRGCFEALSNFITRAGIIVGCVALIAAFIEVVGMVFAVLMLVSLMTNEKALDDVSSSLGCLEEERRLTATRLGKL